MDDGCRIDLYALCLNEARMIPHFLRHYARIVDRFFIYDNGSSDGGLQMLLDQPRLTIRPFETEGESFVEHARRLLNEVWKTSRGSADWVAVVEMDEHLHHADLRAYLKHAHAAGVTAIRSIGYQMAAEAFPTEPRPLWQQVVAGVRDASFDKLAIFRPDAVQETNYAAGRHAAEPSGRVAYETLPQVKLLHYKNLGADYVCARNDALAGGLREGDEQRRWGAHYRRTREAVERDVGDLVRWSRRVPGLARRGPLDLTMDEEELVVRDSGLFDAVFYADAYPGVASRAGIDPISHFCMTGWREGKQPNSCFDPAWYLSRHAGEVSPEVNPLLDYILDGERAGRAPVCFFDPALYRMQHRLPPDRGALRHFLRSEAVRTGRRIAGAP